MFRTPSAALMLLVLFAVPTFAQDASIPGEVTLEVPTFQCLGVRWIVSGDANRNAVVKLEYSPKGRNQWKRALDLFRVETQFVKGVTVPAGSQLFAGSVFDLKEDTEYDLRLTLTDPEGGDAVKTVSSKTRKEANLPEDTIVRFVKPGDGGGSGTQDDPFRGIAAADAQAKPGDAFLLQPGVYKGTVTFTKSGTADKPILWMGPGHDLSIIDGGGAARAVVVPGKEHIIFEDLTIQNATWGMVAHGSSNLTVRRCHFRKIQSGFTSTNGATKHHAILDCVFDGPSTWPRTKGIEDTEAVQVLGDGHVVAYNRIRGFGDAVSIFRSPSNAVDFYNNDISECTDDGIEMDYGGINTRCFRNRLTNCYQGISVQPLYGGPCYIVRNALYNVGLEIFKMHNNPSGFLLLHNTTVKTGMPVIAYAGGEIRNSMCRNNLFVGDGGNYALEDTARMVGADWDYDGYAGGPWQNFAKWNRAKYRTLADFAAESGQEKHGVAIDGTGVFASGVKPPAKIEMQFDVKLNDLRPKAGTAVIDAGVPLPNVNDGFAGKAPDLGAYELGQFPPHYGPRPAKER